MSNYKIYLKTEPDLERETKQNQNIKLVNDMISDLIISQDNQNTNGDIQQIRRIQEKYAEYREKEKQINKPSNIISLVKNYHRMNWIYIISSDPNQKSYSLYKGYQVCNREFGPHVTQDQVIELSEFIKQAKPILREISFITKDHQYMEQYIALYQLNELMLCYEDGLIVPIAMDTNTYDVKMENKVDMDISYEFIYNTIKNHLTDCFDIKGDIAHIKI